MTWRKSFILGNGNYNKSCIVVSDHYIILSFIKSGFNNIKA